MWIGFCTVSYNFVHREWILSKTYNPHNIPYAWFFIFIHFLFYIVLIRVYGGLAVFEGGSTSEKYR